MFVTLLSVLGVAAAVNAASVISIDVGENGLVFKPDSVSANIGDTLAFHFYSGSGPGHSVIAGTLEKPCNPATGGFYSDFHQGSSKGETTFLVNVTSKDPIWFYCGVGSHCSKGMAGVVNPPSGKSISDYQKAATGATVVVPAGLSGGVLTTTSESDDDTTTAAPASTSASAVSASTTVVSTTGTSNGTPVVGSSTVSSTVRASTTGSSASSATSGTAAATTSPSGAGQNKELSIVVGLCVVIGGLVALMG